MEVAQARPVLANRSFRRLWLSLSASVAGDQVLPIAVAVSVLNAGGTAATVGAVLAPRWVALIGFGLFGGVWADRLPRRAVMLGSQAFLTCVAAAALLGGGSLWLLGALVFLGGAAESFFRPAFYACLASVLAPEERARSAALLAVSWRVGAIIGPGAGAVVVTAASARGGFLAAALAFALGTILLVRLSEPDRTPAERSSVVKEIGAGLAEVWRRRWIAVVITVVALQLLFTVAPGLVLLPVISREVFGGDAVYGTSLAVLSAGGLLGALITMRWQPRRPGVAAMLGLAAYGLVPVALLLPFSLWFLYACYLLAGLGLEVFAVQWVVGLQREVPTDRFARVISVDWIASSSMMSLGLVLAGPAAAATGATAVLVTGAVAGLLLPIVAIIFKGMATFHTTNYQS